MKNNRYNFCIRLTIECYDVLGSPKGHTKGGVNLKTMFGTEWGLGVNHVQITRGTMPLYPSAHVVTLHSLG